MSNIKILEVPEFCCASGLYGTHFDAIAALDVSSCRFIELCNYDVRGKKSYAAYSHMPVQQFEVESVVVNAIASLVKAFTDHGGDIEAVSVTIYGGKRFDVAHYLSSVRILISAFDNQGIIISKDNLAKDLWMDVDNQSIEFLFSADATLYLKMVDPDREENDLYPEQLTLQQRVYFCNLLRGVRSQSHRLSHLNTNVKLQNIRRNRDVHGRVQDLALLATDIIPSCNNERFVSEVADVSNVIRSCNVSSSSASNFSLKL